MDIMLYIIPCFVCLVWAVIFKFRRKNATQQLLMQLQIVGASYFLVYALYVSPHTEFRRMCMFNVVATPLILALAASILIYLHAHLKVRKVPTGMMQWLYLPAIIDGVGLAIGYYLLGLDRVLEFTKLYYIVDNRNFDFNLFNLIPPEYNTNLYQLFYFFDVAFFNVMAALMVLVIFFLCFYVSKADGYRLGDVFRFFFKGNPTTPSRAVSFWITLILITELPLLALGRVYISHHPMMGAAMSVLLAIELFCLCYCEYFSFIPTYKLRDLAHVEFSLEDPVLSAAEKNIPLTATLTSEKAIEKTNQIIEQLQYAMETEQVYLDPEVKLVDLAEKFGVNRNKLSLLVNQMYGVDFKTLVAQRRIEKAQQMMKEDPTATMETIATQCGFKDTSAFFHRFRQITGDTPSLWKMK